MSEALDPTFRPQPLKGSRSFSRLEPNQAILSSVKSRSRSSTLSSVSTPDQVDDTADHKEAAAPQEPSLEKRLEKATLDDAGHSLLAEVSEDPNDLPIEVLALTDRFAASLTAKVHPAPLTLDRLSDMFQDFYVDASAALATHISHLYLSLSSKAAASSSRLSEQQMVSINEISRRIRDRKLLEIKKLAMEEAVERRVTEKMYEKIWRHKGAEDEARDEALRSKTLALGVVGVGLKELGVNETLNVEDLKPVIEALLQMNNAHYPLGKLRLLKSAHKLIVDSLAKTVTPSSSSADDILPTLIYTVMISPPELNLISNLNFMQRFRARKAIDGETAYCLTNLEAAISFLETVDLRTLLSEESQGEAVSTGTPSIDERQGIPSIRKSEPTTSVTSATVAGTTPEISASKANSLNEDLLSKPSSPPHSPAARRISYLAPVEFATSAATSAVSTAEQNIKSIGSTLETSYKFFLGKMSDRRAELPRTLDEARKLVGTPIIEKNENIKNSPKTSFFTVDAGDAQAKVDVGSPVGLSLFGVSMQRTSSSDSNRSRRSTNASIVPKSIKTEEPELPIPVTTTTPATPSTPLFDSINPVGVATEGVRNLGNQLGRFAGNFKSFSRAQASRTPPPTSSVPDEKETVPSSELLSAFPDLATTLPPPSKPTIAAPLKRFIESEAGDLRLKDVEELLADYKRLAEGLRKLGAFS